MKDEETNVLRKIDVYQRIETDHWGRISNEPIFWQKSYCLFQSLATWNDI